MCVCVCLCLYLCICFEIDFILFHFIILFDLSVHVSSAGNLSFDPIHVFYISLFMSFFTLCFSNCTCVVDVSVLSYFVCLIAGVFRFRFGCQCACACIFLLTVCLYVCLFVHCFICLVACPSVSLSVCLYVSLEKLAEDTS